MGTPGPQKINRYGIAFKLNAVQMSKQPGVLIKDVAESLCIHPFMLSRWRKQVRDGKLVGKVPALDAASVAELRRLRRNVSSKPPITNMPVAGSGTAVTVKLAEAKGSRVPESDPPSISKKPL